MCKVNFVVPPTENTLNINLYMYIYTDLCSYGVYRVRMITGSNTEEADSMQSEGLVSVNKELAQERGV